MSTRRRLFYFAPVNYPAYEARIGAKLLVGAAARKVASVAHALRSADICTLIVSSPVLGQALMGKLVGSIVLRQLKVPVIYLPTIGCPGLSRLISVFTYGAFSLFHVRRRDKVILYNYYLEYLLAALVLRAKGCPAILDIEDAPRADEKGMRAWVNRLSFRILIVLCDCRCLTASTQISHIFGSRPTCVVYGVLEDTEQDHINRDFSKDDFRLLYGGTLCTDTGLELFCQAVLLLKDRLPKDGRKLQLVVTGFGGDLQIADLAATCEGSAVFINQKTNLTVREYREELLASHGGLCLKMPNSSIGDTTFPSKVVEIAAAGLLLISTQVSDVPALFGSDGAMLLDEATPDALCATLIRAMQQPQECAERARRGHELAVQHFSAAGVGRKVMEFLFE